MVWNCIQQLNYTSSFKVKLHFTAQQTGIKHGMYTWVKQFKASIVKQVLLKSNFTSYAFFYIFIVIWKEMNVECMISVAVFHKVYSEAKGNS